MRIGSKTLLCAPKGQKGRRRKFIITGKRCDVLFLRKKRFYKTRLHDVHVCIKVFQCINHNLKRRHNTKTYITWHYHACKCIVFNGLFEIAIFSSIWCYLEMICTYSYHHMQFLRLSNVWNLISWKNIGFLWTKLSPSKLRKALSKARVSFTTKKKSSF